MSWPEAFAYVASFATFLGFVAFIFWLCVR